MNLRSSLKVYFQRFMAVNTIPAAKSLCIPLWTDGSPLARSLPGGLTQHTFEYSSLWQQRLNLYTYLNLLRCLPSPPWSFSDLKLGEYLQVTLRLHCTALALACNHCSLG